MRLVFLTIAISLGTSKAVIDRGQPVDFTNSFEGHQFHDKQSSRPMIPAQPAMDMPMKFVLPPGYSGSNNIGQNAQNPDIYRYRSMAMSDKMILPPGYQRTDSSSNDQNPQLSRWRSIPMMRSEKIALPPGYNGAVSDQNNGQNRQIWHHAPIPMKMNEKFVLPPGYNGAGTNRMPQNPRWRMLPTEMKSVPPGYNGAGSSPYGDYSDDGNGPMRGGGGYNGAGKSPDGYGSSDEYGSQNGYGYDQPRGGYGMDSMGPGPVIQNGDGPQNEWSYGGSSPDGTPYGGSSDYYTPPMNTYTPNQGQDLQNQDEMHLNYDDSDFARKKMIMPMRMPHAMPQ